MPNASSASRPFAAIQGFGHAGISVASLDAALGFWEPFLGRPARWRRLLDKPYLGRIVGYPGVRIEAALVDLPGGGVLELLDYLVADKAANPQATANAGSFHLCLTVDDAEAVWRHAVACGAQPVTPQGPVAIDAGPNAGATAAYLRIHDGVTLELVQLPSQPSPQQATA